MFSRLKRKLAHQRGQATIEMAFALLIFGIFMLIITDMLRIGYSWITLQYAVNEGARIASLEQGFDSGGRIAAIQSRVVDVATALGINNVSVSVDDSTSVAEVEATATVNLTPFSDLVLNFGGNYDRTYNIVAQTAVRS